MNLFDKTDASPNVVETKLRHCRFFLTKKSFNVRPLLSPQSQMTMLHILSLNSQRKTSLMSSVTLKITKWKLGKHYFISTEYLHRAEFSWQTRNPSYDSSVLTPLLHNKSSNFPSQKIVFGQRWSLTCIWYLKKSSASNSFWGARKTAASQIAFMRLTEHI